jgi:23S rRNA (pseudouridine1915-N3)-methyltransferase
VGKIKEHFYQRGIEHYLIRLKPYARISVIELQEGKSGGKDSSPSAALLEEAEGIEKYIRNDAYSIVLDADGKKMRSEELAYYLERLMIEGKSKLDFIIGGPDGLAYSIKKRGDLCLSLSDLTFPHRLARLILLEQLYRCFKIIRGEPYHK